MRSITKVILGKATPFQLLAACVLGAALGFTPGFAAAPGLIVALLLLLVVLNANLALAALVAAPAKLMSLAIMPITFEVGRLLLDGPAQPLFRSAVNTPGLALFGLEHYVTTGGLALGVLLGLVVGLVVVTLVLRLRRLLAGLQAGSDRYRAVTSKLWVRVGSYLFLGASAGADFAALAKKKVGLPVRPLGVLFVGLVAGLAFVGYRFLSEPITTMLARRGLERANGATVDLASAKLDLGAGKVVLSGLAICDPEQLSTDLFRAATLEADVSGRDLLRKRLALDLVVVRDASTGEARAVPGRRLTPKPPPPAPEPGPGKTIDDYLKDAQVWKDRLTQVRRWLDEIAKRRQDGRAPAPSPDGTPTPKQETLRERLEREVREKGYRKVVASHLIEGAPTLLVRRLEAQGVRAAQAPGEVIDIAAANLSTQPWLVEGAPSVEVKTRSGSLDAGVMLAAVSKPGGTASLRLALTGVATDSVMSGLVVGGERPVSGGTMDVRLDGALSPDAGWRIDLPMQVTLRDATLTLPVSGAAALAGQAGGAGGASPSARVAQFTLPIGLSGPIDAPRITVDEKALGDALAQAGASELASQVRARAQEQIDKATQDVKDKLAEEAGDALKDVAPGLTDKLGDDLGKGAGDAAKGALEGLFGGGGKKDEKKEEKKEEAPK